MLLAVYASIVPPAHKEEEEDRRGEKQTGLGNRTL